MSLRRHFADAGDFLEDLFQFAERQLRHFGGAAGPAGGRFGGFGIWPVMSFSTSCGGWTSIASFVPSRVVRYW